MAIYGLLAVEPERYRYYTQRSQQIMPSLPSQNLVGQELSGFRRRDAVEESG